MQKFKERLLKDKTISVWGMGYLGYTTTLRLIKEGFKVNIYQFDNINLKIELLEGTYPTLEQKSLWSINGNIPKIDLERIKIKTNVNDMFDASVHVIAMPIIDKNENTLKTLLNIFKTNYSKDDNSLILFQSAEAPNIIENKFINILLKDKIKYSYASGFRTDWNIEEFFSDKYTRVIAAYDNEALNKVKIVFKLLNINFIELSSINESSIYVNAKNSLKYTISGFFNQLSLAYNDVNINSFTSLILNDFNANDIQVGFNLTDFKNANSIEHLLKGTENNDICTIIKEAQSTNMSLILYYAELLKNKALTSVLILGISTQDALKDIRFSPSIIMAEYLNKLGFEIFINDPNFTPEEIYEILGFAKYIDLNTKITQDAILVMKDYKEYKYLTQEDIHNKGFFNTSIIIDNIGLFQDFTFSENTIYHRIGDGNLKRLSK